MIKFILLIVLAGHAIDMAESSSIKMDFLPFANVRTDPIINPNELSDHIHTFYGATAARPETTYEDLRNAYGGSGDAEENQSLYWHPTVYRVDSENGVHHMVDMHIASAYYIWTPGVTRAFPNGFKMISFIPEEETDGFFNEEEPSEELETEIWFPDCWDGINLDSNDHMSHVAFSSNRDVSGTCPDTHPVKIPKIEFFVRVAPYLGGTHVFSDGTTRLHADYFSGWDQEKLQHVLDNCDNGSFESAPDMFCENFLTFKDAPKISGACGSLDAHFAKTAAFQPPPLDTSTITTEPMNELVSLPRGAGTGTLLFGPPQQTLPPAPTPAPLPFLCDGDAEGEDEVDEGDGGGENEDAGGEGEDNEDGGEGEGEDDEGGDDEGEGDEEDEEGGDEEEDEDSEEEGDDDEGAEEDGDEEGEDEDDEEEGGGEEDEGEEEGEDDEGEEEGEEKDEGDDESRSTRLRGSCGDRTGSIFINDRVGKRDCEWLGDRTRLARRKCTEDSHVQTHCCATCRGIIS